MSRPIQFILWFLATTLHCTMAAPVVSQRFSSRDDAGSAFHQIGLDLTQRGDKDLLVKSLAYLRAAVKAVPSNAGYWNDLGVAEATAGLLPKARQRFVRALDVDPTHGDALNNLKRANTELSSKKKKNENVAPSSPPLVKHESLHHIEPLFVLESLPFVEGTADRSLVMNRPYIVRNAYQKMTGLHTPSQASLMDYLFSTFPESAVDFYPQNMLSAQPDRLYTLPLNQALNQIVGVPDLVYSDVDASLSGSYVQWNMNSSEWIQMLRHLGIENKLLYPFNGIPTSLSTEMGDHLLSCLGNQGALEKFLKATHWLMTLVGEEGAGMHNHQDDLRAGSFQLQLLGRKKWNICPPQDSVWNGHDWVLRDGSLESNESYLYGAGAVDMFEKKINYRKFPLLVNATCYQGVVDPGDLIYYPKDFWHQTLNIDTPSVAISSNVLTMECLSEVLDRLRRECDASVANTRNNAAPIEPGQASSSPAIGEVSGSGEYYDFNGTSLKYGFTREMCNSLLGCIHSR